MVVAYRVAAVRVIPFVQLGPRYNTALPRTKWNRYITRERWRRCSPVVISDDEKHVFAQESLFFVLRVRLGGVVRRFEAEPLPVVDLLEQFEQRPIVTTGTQQTLEHSNWQYSPPFSSPHTQTRSDTAQCNEQQLITTMHTCLESRIENCNYIILRNSSKSANIWKF